MNKIIPWLFDELFDWSLFFLLTYLFFLALPEWAKVRNGPRITFDIQAAQQTDAPDPPPKTP